MAADLPTDFDYIVLGTGLTETILAAAFSRNGYKVLHLDRLDHYSDQWASFNLKTFEKFAADQKETNKDEKETVKDVKDKLEEGETSLKLPLVNSLITDLNIKYYVKEKEKPSDNEITDKLQGLEINSSINTQLTETESEISKDIVETSHQEIPEQKTQALEENVNDTDTKSFLGSSSDNTEIKHDSKGSKDDAQSDESTSHLASSHIAEESEDSAQSNIPNVSDNPKTQKPTVDTIQADDTTTKEDVNNSQTQSTTGKSSIEEGVEAPLKKKKIWTKDGIQDSWRSFNLDLAPKVLYSSGKMVELLISSDVAKYCEFRTVSRVLTQNKDSNIEKIPCSRADVFSSKDVSMLDKRKLMKFLEWCSGYHNNPEAYTEYENKTFHDILKSRNLSESLQNIIMNAISMVSKDALAKEGLEKTQTFLQSVGRYGNTPFLFPLYGSGELPQAFCRLCAVFGGTYCLCNDVHSLILDNHNKCQAIITDAGQRINSKWLIMGTSYAPQQFINSNRKRISRCILFTDRSLLNTDTQELSLLWVSPDNTTTPPVFVLELPQSAMVCPKDMYVVHLTCEGTEGGPELDFSPFVQKYFTMDTENQDPESNQPSILWSAYFTQSADTVNPDSNIPDNIYIIPGPDTTIHMDSPVIQAKKIFEEICPEDVFLPKPPHPDDIIYVDETEATVGGGETWDGQKEEKESEDAPTESTESSDVPNKTSQEDRTISTAPAESSNVQIKTEQENKNIQTVPAESLDVRSETQ